MAESYSSSLLVTATDQFLSKTRDLYNPDLSPFYTSETVSLSEAQDRFTTSDTARMAGGLPAVTDSQFAFDLSPNSQQLFLDVLSGIGIAPSIVNDLVSQDQTLAPLRAPTAPFLSELTAQGTALDTTLIADLVSRLGSTSSVDPTTTLHLLEEAPRLIADDDDLINDRLLLAKTYVKALLP